jgi:hypothetical protein
MKKDDEFKWEEEAFPAPPTHTKLVAKIPVEKIVIDENQNVFMYQIINKKVIYTFLYNAFPDYVQPKRGRIGRALLFLLTILLFVSIYRWEYTWPKYKAGHPYHPRMYATDCKQGAHVETFLINS